LTVFSHFVFSRMDLIEIEIAKVNAKEVAQVKKHNETSQRIKQTVSYYQQQLKFHTDRLEALNTRHEESLELLAAQKARWTNLKAEREAAVNTVLINPRTLMTEQQKEENALFATFRNERIRRSPGANTPFLEFVRVFRHWSEWKDIRKRMDSKTLRKKLEDEFGWTDGDKFRNIIVLLSDEDVEEWDANHKNQ